MVGVCAGCGDAGWGGGQHGGDHFTLPLKGPTYHIVAWEPHLSTPLENSHSHLQVLEFIEKYWFSLGEEGEKVVLEPNVM